jgi:hypothetical protein
VSIGNLLHSSNTVSLSEERILELRTGDEFSQALYKAITDDDLSKILQKLKKRFGVIEIGSLVQDYITSTLTLSRIKGPFRIVGISRCINRYGTFEKILKIDRYGKELFPAITIGGDNLGTKFWLLLTNGDVITLHQDATFFEVAQKTAQVSSDSLAFVDAFSGRGSLVNIYQLVCLQTKLHALAHEKNDEEKVIAAVCECLGVTPDVLKQVLRYNRSEFLQMYFSD